MEKEEEGKEFWWFTSSEDLCKSCTDGSKPDLLVFQTLLGLPKCWVYLNPVYGPPFLSAVDVPGANFSQTIFCQVFLGLATGTFPSTTNLVHAFTQSALCFPNCLYSVRLGHRCLYGATSNKFIKYRCATV